MSKKLKGTLIGVVASLVGLVLYAVFYAYLDMIAGVAAILMGGLFLFVYKKMNPEDNSAYPIIIAIVLTIVEVAAGYFLGILLVCLDVGVSFADVFEIDGIKSAIAQDLIFGYLFGGVALAVVLFAEKRQRDMKKVKNAGTYYVEYPEEDKKETEDKKPVDNGEIIDVEVVENKKEEDKNNEEGL